MIKGETSVNRHIQTLMKINNVILVLHTCIILLSFFLIYEIYSSLETFSIILLYSILNLFIQVCGGYLNQKEKTQTIIM